MKKRKAAGQVVLQDTIVVHEVLLHRWLFYGCSAILAVLIPLFYFPSLHYNFQFDDLASITKYFNIRSNTFGNLFLTSPRWISYWINSIHYKMGRFDPFGYRLFNVCLHTITTLLVFFFLYRALSGLKKSSFFRDHALSIAFTAAGLFGLHPVQTQTVSYVIQGQLEGLAGFFMIAGSLCFLLMYQRSDFVKQCMLGSLLIFLIVAGTGSKEIFIVMPVLLLLTDWFFVAQGQWDSLSKRWFIHSVIFFIIFFMYIHLLKPGFFSDLIGLKLQATNNAGNMLTQEKETKILPLHFLISQFKVILHYIGMFLWPFGICIEYDWKLSESFFAFDCIVPFSILWCVVMLIVWLLLYQRAQYAVFGALWFFAVIAPRSSIIPSSELLTDYKTYGASLGIMFILASLIVWLLSYAHTALQKSWSPSALMVTRVIVISVLLLPVGFATIDRNSVWRSGEEFWKNVIENAPGKTRAYNNYAVSLAEKRQYKEAIPYYLKALEMEPDYADAWNNLAIAYGEIGDLDKGIECLKKDIELKPSYPEGYNNLASFLIRKKEYDKALEALRMALKLRKHYGKAYCNLCSLYLEKDQHEQAWQAIKHACIDGDLDNDLGTLTLYGRLSMFLEKHEDCINAYTKLLELKPNFEHTFELANAYALQGDYDKATKWYQKAHELNPHDMRLAYNLGELMERQGRYQQALDYFTDAYDFGSQMPYLPLRMAQCLYKLDRNMEASSILHDVLDNDAFPDQIRGEAHKMLGQLA